MNFYIPAALGVGAACGFGLGYVVAKNRFEMKYKKLADEEIEEMKVYFRHREQATEARLKAPLNEVMDYLGYQKDSDFSEPSEESLVNPDQLPLEEVPPEVPEETRNVFEDTSSDHVWDYAVESRIRSANPGRPFVIHLDEFGEEGRQTVCFTYYEEDEILADDRDEPVDNVDELIGLENLNRFGHGTDNINILLIRNETIELDIEIAKSGGSYAEDVKGFLKHEQYQIEKIRKRHESFDDD